MTLDLLDGYLMELLISADQENKNNKKQCDVKITLLDGYLIPAAMER
jgi:hypothetical protein